MIPIYRSNGDLFCHAELERLLEYARHFQVVRNRRGHVKRAYLKENITFDQRPVSTIGLAFEQPVSTGHVWALRGVRGSGLPNAIPA